MAADTEYSPSAMRRLAADSLASRDFVGVEKWCRRALKIQPQDAEAWYLLGCAALQAGRGDVAQSCLHEAATHAPERADYLIELARSYSMMWRHSEAAAFARQALALEPPDAKMLNSIGEILMRADEAAEARPVFERAVRMAPGVAGFQFNLASACRVVGDLVAAQQACEAALDIDAGNHRAWSMLAELDPTVVADKRFETLKRALAASGDSSADAQLHIGFALARAWEARNDFGKAFEVMKASKAPVRRLLNYSFASDAQLFETLTQLFESPLAESSVDGSASDRPIFVMGMPRTGTTLLDRMLSGHPDVVSAGEVHNFGILLQRGAGDDGLGVPAPQHLRDALRIDLQEVGERYLESVAGRVRDARRFVDKLPHNFLFAGYISRALPHAKMLCLRRNALDTCIGNFRQMFALSFPYYRYSYDLDDTAQYYIEFNKLMAHWHKVLPGRILEVSYEKLARQPEAQLRRVLEFCNLEWDPACLAIENNTAPVTTASAVQVREGINTRSIGRWRKYESNLGSVLAALKNAGIEIESD